MYHERGAVKTDIAADFICQACIDGNGHRMTVSEKIWMCRQGCEQAGRDDRITRDYDGMEQEFAREQRWNYLVEEYQTMLYRVAFANMRNRADAEDAVQEAFLRYMKDEKPILNREHEKAWLIRTTIHICMDILKSSWHRRTVPLEESLMAESKAVYLPYQVRDDRILEAVLKLPVHYRNPIYLFYYEDYSIHEIAGVLHEKEGTIKTRLRRGREEVKKLLT